MGRDGDDDREGEGEVPTPQAHPVAYDRMRPVDDVLPRVRSPRQDAVRGARGEAIRRQAATRFAERRGPAAFSFLCRATCIRRAWTPQHTVTPPSDDSKHWPASSAGWMQAHVGFETHCAGIGAHPSAGGHAPWLIRSQICVVGSQ
jgi:hypothetical protein